jgi:photosystem II stability/assembly factor-like uncharacterized protein
MPKKILNIGKKFKNNRLFLILLLLAAVNTFSQNTWIRQSTPTNLWLYKCSFPDSITGWAAGEDGVIIKTTNGGLNWVSAVSPVDFFIYDIYFLNKRLGWALANDNFVNGTAVLTTTNSGENWSMYRFPDSTTLLYSVYFTDSLNGFMGGYGGKLYRTTNGGANWFHASVDSSAYSGFPIDKVRINGNTGIAVGGSYDIVGVIWISNNGGVNWHTWAFGSEPLLCFDFLSQSKIVVLGGDYDFGVVQAKTYDAGSNWNYDYLNTFGIPRGLSFRTQSEGWGVLSISARFYYTLDTGNSWNVMNVPDTISLYDITFTDPYHGYAVGNRGGVYRYNTNTIGIINNHNGVPESDLLYQNYPNPFNPLTTIEYFISRPSAIKIIIYDITGREVKIIYDGLQGSGTHKIKFDSSELSSGVYFYKLEAGDFTESKKMVIIK